jgi:putative NADPH-quinone reductase
MKTIVVVYCHPYKQSFNHAVLEKVIQSLIAQNLNPKVLDLYAEQFEPVYDPEELRLFHTGQTHDPLVTEYLQALKAAAGVIFITPIWWNSLPGMLKGFIDKVMKEGEGLSHTVSKTGIKGELTNLKRAYVLTTSTSPTFYLRLFCGNAIQKIFIHKTLKQLGVHSGKWLNFGGITNSSLKRRQRYLQSVTKMSFRF